MSEIFNARCTICSWPLFVHQQGQPCRTPGESAGSEPTLGSNAPVLAGRGRRLIWATLDAGEWARAVNTADIRASDCPAAVVTKLRESFARSIQDQPTLEGHSQAARDVLSERHRQISAEGWTPEHDDGHAEGELSYAAAGYCVSASDGIQRVMRAVDGNPSISDDCTLDFGTPWPEGWEFKVAPPRRLLVKAAALILAELERLDRQAAKAATSETPPASTCSYPTCTCPFDAPADPNWCARGRPKKVKGAGK